jgi:hypothetical protein
MVTTILSENSTTFKSYNSDKDPEIYCDVTITVKHLKYEDGEQFIDIAYNYGYSKKHPSVYRTTLPDTHPFYDESINIQEHKVGDIVKFNPMIKAMIKMLFIPDDQMDQYVGKTYPDDYKKGIMLSLLNFWD